jgi:DNA repair protein RecN (Recombination protein N)
MLKSLYIHNYALISDLEIKFRGGFSIITGETGAGKSIILGALSLVLGQRADTSVIGDKAKKCIIEAVFNIKQYKLQHFFERNDLDYEEEAYLRRQISPGGKSRAFINDVPVNLPLLKELGDNLVDIHSQHSNLLIREKGFQFLVVDSMANHMATITTFRTEYTKLRKLERKLSKIEDLSRQEQKDIDYYQFQFDELNKAKLQEYEQQEVEEELEILSHAEDIKSNLSIVHNHLQGEDISILSQLRDSIKSAEHIISFYPKANEFKSRLNSVLIELEDLSEEVEIVANDTEFDPERFDFLNERINLIYSLQKKHQVNSVKELLDIQDQLEKRLQNFHSYEEQITNLRSEIKKQSKQTESIALKISENRKKAVPIIEKQLSNYLKSLGMPHAVFRVLLTRRESMNENGYEEIEFRFSADKKREARDISQVASGGEMSRVMLSLKSILSSSINLPTIIFDEIDTGVSGEIADKMGHIMKKVSQNIQVLNITHLPQIASRGDHHFLVYKEDGSESTNTYIKELTREERIYEIAKMLSGENMTEAAISNAKILLEN